jgi:hypothetical protein
MLFVLIVFNDLNILKNAILMLLTTHGVLTDAYAQKLPLFILFDKC